MKERERERERAWRLHEREEVDCCEESGNHAESKDNFSRALRPLEWDFRVGHLRVMDQITLVRPCGRPSLWAAEVREARLVSLLPAKVGRGPTEDKGCQSKWLRLGRNATS